MELIRLTARSRNAAESSIQFYLNEIENEKSNPYEMQSLLKPKALVVDGKTLTYILDLKWVFRVYLEVWQFTKFWMILQIEFDKAVFEISQKLRFRIVLSINTITESISC